MMNVSLSLDFPLNIVIFVRLAILPLLTWLTFQFELLQMSQMISKMTHDYFKGAAYLVIDKLAPKGEHLH